MIQNDVVMTEIGVALNNAILKYSVPLSVVLSQDAADVDEAAAAGPARLCERHL